MQIRYIADLHLYDPTSINWRGTKYTSLDHAAQTILVNWNNVVNPDDITVIVGDIGKQCGKTIDILRALKGTKVLVMGNHDYEWNFDVLKDRCDFYSVLESLKLPKGLIVHIPEVGHYAQTIIHGHQHEYESSAMFRARASYEHDNYRYNCAADLNGMKPCTFNELVTNKEIMLYKGE